MKRVIIVHCWGGYPKYCWYPYVKRELESKRFEVLVPAMPDTENPNLKNWLPKLKEVIGVPDKDLYLIGHSAGCITIMRYLETLDVQEKIGGVVFVAGFSDDLGIKELKNFFTTPVNFKKIKSKAKNFVVIRSDDDPYVPMNHGDILKKELSAELITKHQMKHFSGAGDGEKDCTELPDVINAIMKMSKD